MWNGRVLLGRNPVFAGDRFSASYFETDFASFLAWRDWGFPDPGVFNGFGMGALRCADGAFVLGEMGQHTVQRRAHLLPVRHARSRRHQGRHGRYSRQRRARTRGRDRALRPAITRASRTGTASTPDRAIAMIRILRSICRAKRLRDRIEANLARQRQPELSAIHLVRGTRRSHRRNAAFCHGVHRGATVGLTLTCRRRRIGPAPADARNTLDIWSRYQCDRRNKNKKTQCTKIIQEIIQGGFPCRGAKLHAFSLGCLPQSRCWGWRFPPRPRRKKIKIGVIYDLTGPLAGGGSELQYIGAKIMLDQYTKTGVEGYKIEAVYADAQSKPDVAINEAVRLIEQEKVDMLLGFYSSAQCVPVAGARRAAEEVHVDHHLHFFRGARRQELQIRVPPAGLGRPVRADDDGFHRPELEIQARQGAEGSARRHHPRGRRLRRRRLEGQRGRRQEGRFQHRDEGRLFRHRAGSFRPRHQAEARAARRGLPHRL